MEACCRECNFFTVSQLHFPVGFFGVLGLALQRRCASIFLSVTILFSAQRGGKYSGRENCDAFHFLAVYFVLFAAGTARLLVDFSGPADFAQTLAGGR
jgi:hypothetical protein